ncbi:MAG: hypothetical protein AAB367_04025 [Patescibacteria group bacterium]
MPALADVQAIVGTIVDKIVNPFFMLLFGIATLLFMWGIIEMMMNAEDTEARENGKRHIVWGILGAAIMLGTGGIIRLLMSIWK